MDPRQFNEYIIKPSLSLLDEITGKTMNTPMARRMLVAIAVQESELTHRRQVEGPALGWWQFEPGGGIYGVRTHQATGSAVEKILETLRIDNWHTTINEAIPLNDTLACCFARLLLWTHPDPLPTTRAKAWEYYERLWRPGKPHPEHWQKSWSAATNVE